MKNSIFNSISIPKPCHEDWDKMTPDAKGAFCGSCQKSVYDFSTKSEAEVEEVLNNVGDDKVCGRFSADQLREEIKLDIPLYSLPRNIAPMRAFALALFLVFGTLLFTGSNAYGQKMGKVRIVTKEPRPVEMRQGSVAYVPKDTKPVCIPKPEDTIKGDMIYDPKPIKPIKDSVLPPKKDTVKIMMMGKVARDPIVEEKIVEIAPPVKGLIVKKADPKPEIKQVVSVPAIEMKLISMECFPNPTKGETTIRYTLKKGGMVKMDVYDMNGSKVKTLINEQNMYAGVYSTAFDLKELHSGIYFCCLHSNDLVETTKIVITR